MWTQSTKFTADSIGHEEIAGVCRISRLIQNQNGGLYAVQVQIGGEGEGWLCMFTCEWFIFSIESQQRDG